MRKLLELYDESSLNRGSMKKRQLSMEVDHARGENLISSCRSLAVFIAALPVVKTVVSHSKLLGHGSFGLTD